MSDQPQYPTYPDYQQQQPQQPYAPYVPPPPPKKGGMGKWIALGGCGCFLFLAVLAGVGFFVWQMTKAPMQAVNDQLAALRSNDVEKAYNDCSSGFKKETSLEQFREFVEAYPLFKISKEFTSLNRKTENGVTSLEGNIETTDGMKHPAEYRVVKEGGSYKVHYIHVKESAPEQQSEPAKEPQQEPNQESSGPSPSGSNLEIFDVRIDKSQEANDVKVTIAFQVQGFENTHSGNEYSLNLVQDLETLDPDGARLSDLSREGIKTLTESGPGEYTSANFSNTLTIPLQYAHGTYTVRLRVHDLIGGGVAEHEETFEFP